MEEKGNETRRKGGSKEKGKGVIRKESDAVQICKGEAGQIREKGVIERAKTQGE